MQGLFTVLGTGVRVYHLVIPFVETTTWEMLSRFGPKWNRPESLDLVDRFSHVCNLHLYNIGLTSVPAYLGRLRNLERLSLFRNRLKSLPAQWANPGQMPRLEYLCVERNQIVHLPSEWGVEGSFPSLGRINISYNPITTLPAEWATLGAFPELVHIYAEELDLLDVPDQWGRDGVFPSLKHIWLTWPPKRKPSSSRIEWIIEYEYAEQLHDPHYGD